MPGENELNTELGKVKPRVLRESRKPSIRLQVVAIWLFVALLYGLTRSETAWHLFEVASAAAVSFFLLPFVQGPYLLYTRQSLPLRAGFRMFSGQLEPALPVHRLIDLTNLGFEFAGQLVQDPGKRNAVARLGVFVHSENKDSAQLGHIVSGLKTIPFLVFKSRFEDGFAFETSNSHGARIFDSDPNYPVFRFPNLRSTADLYLLHRTIKEQISASRRPVAALGEAELAEFIARAEVVRQRHASSGDYKLAPSGEYYVYNWSGAIRHAWLMGWPVKSIRAMRAESQAMKTAQRFGFRIDPKRGRIFPV